MRVQYAMNSSPWLYQTFTTCFAIIGLQILLLRIQLLKTTLKTESKKSSCAVGQVMDLWSDFIGFFTGILAPVADPPLSALFILIVSVSLALIASWATMRFSDVEQTRKNMEEISEWRRKLDVARKTMDPMLLQEVQDQQARIMRLNAELMSSRCKPMCIYYIPFIIIFGILNALYAGVPVAILPFNAQKLLPFIDPMLGTNLVGGGFGLWFWPWYLLSSLGLGNLIRKFLGVGVELGM